MNLQAAIALYAGRRLDGRTVFQGLQISIENKKGSVRSGVSPDGKKWRTKMTYPYGYIRRTEGVDGDHVDCFIGPDAQADTVYIARVRRPPEFTEYDEDKCFLGFDSEAAARTAFAENYDDPRFLGSMDSSPMDEFKRKVLGTASQPARISARMEKERL